MQVFITHPESLMQSAIDLDDRRLNKQILEAWQIINGQWKKHPVSKHYHNSTILSDYLKILCKEYEFRFDKQHNLYLMEYFTNATKKVEPFYIKGRKNRDQVITNNNVGELYRQLLGYKWIIDKLKGNEPKWTKRKKPTWYQGD